MRALVLVFALGVLMTGRIAVAADAAFLDYLYMEPNEGGSSAGHVAVALGDRTFAYQRSADGWLVLERDDLEHLRWLYAVLGNRAIERSRVAVAPAVLARLRDGFTRRWLVQEAERALLHRLAVGERVTAALASAAGAASSDPSHAAPADVDAAAATVAPPVPASGGAPDAIKIEAAGYFEAAGSESSPALVRLRDAIAAAHGRSFLDTRIAGLRAGLAALAPGDDGPPPAVVPDTYPAPHERFADRWLTAASGIVALETLRRAPGLDPVGLVTADAPPLAPVEAAALATAADGLQRALVRLVASARADFGFPLLVGMARLAAIERSLATGRLVVLDAFPADARRIPHAAVRRTAEAARGLRDDACADLAASRRAFAAAAAPAERELVALEDTADRCVELTRGLAEARDVRVAGDLLVPSRPGPMRDVVVPRVPRARLAVAARAAADAHRAYARAFVDAYRYDLVRRNCVTETFATIEAVLGPDADAALGGRVTGTGERVIPALARRGVRRRWRLAASDTTPSYRSLRVAELARAGNPFVVRLRESNVLTSTIYRPSPDDSAFLFFTDDALALRPVLGAANLVVGAGATLLGLLQAPLDRGAALERGARGMLWSVPELFFVNVRKGSFDRVERDGALLPVATTQP